VRLLAVVCASTSAMDAVLVRQPHVHAMALGGWISLAVVDPDDGAVRRLDASGCWVRDDVIELDVDRVADLVAD
jgi:hypothetical protein